MKFTKKEMMNAFFLYLDDSLPSFECKKINDKGNVGCQFRCNKCMMEQYLKRIRSGEMPKIEIQNDGSYYPEIN